MPRTLKALTGERPRCQYCDKPLRPATSTLELSRTPERELRTQSRGRNFVMPETVFSGSSTGPASRANQSRTCRSARHIRGLRHRQGRHQAVLLAAVRPYVRRRLLERWHETSRGNKSTGAPRCQRSQPG